VSSCDVQNDRHLTARGARTQARIIDAAADLIYTEGAAATTLDKVVVASGVSKSQFYRHFSGKAPLLMAVIDHVGNRVLERERSALRDVSTLEGLQHWRDTLVLRNAEENGAYGCALGSLGTEIADQDADAREALARFFVDWERLLADVIRRLQESGAISSEHPATQLATGLMGALQGGYVLAQLAHDASPMATSLDMALAHIESLVE
jgi:TetR/AcrR family transcriptional repressor of nem operon